MIKIQYILRTSIHTNIEDKEPCVVETIHNSKEQAEKSMRAETIEELSKGKQGVIGEDYAITWEKEEKKFYVERIVIPEIKKY